MKITGIMRAAVPCVILLSVIFNCSPSLAAVSSLKASVDLREEYDDNILLTKENRVFDYITRVTPNISLAYKTQWWDLKMEDTFYWWYYARKNANYYSNSMNLSSKLAVVQNLLYLDVTDNYSNVVLEPRGPSTEVNFNVNRTDSNVINVSPYLKYEIDTRDTVKAGYKYTNIWYRNNGVNRQQHDGFGSVGHKFTPELEVVVGGDYLADRPERVEPDNNQTTAYATLIYDFDPRTKFGGTAGYRWLRFSNSTGQDRLMYNAGLAYVLSESGKVECRASSGIIPTPLNGVAEEVKQEIKLQYGILAGASSIKGSAYHSEDKYVEIVRTDEAFGLTAGLDLVPNPRMRYQISGGYEWDKYNPQNQNRDVYYVGAGADYKVTPKVALGLTYRYYRSAGTVKADDYIDNLAGLQLKAEL